MIPLKLSFYLLVENVRTAKLLVIPISTFDTGGGLNNSGSNVIINVLKYSLISSTEIVFGIFVTNKLYGLDSI